MHGLAIFLQTFVAASIFFVWGVRHSNIGEEFKEAKLPNCRLPNWLRDLLAILKITGAILLLVGINRPRGDLRRLDDCRPTVVGHHGRKRIL